jgi:hypothetical protein
MDLLGEILWYAMFFTPVITIPLFWRFDSTSNKKMKVINGMLLAFLISLVFLVISLTILFRNGLGPT